MTKHHFLYPILIGVIALFASFWIKDAIAHARAEAVEQAQKQIQTEAQKRIDDREKQFETEKSKLLDAIKRVKTPVQAVQSLPIVVELPKPIQLLPNAPSATGGDSGVSGGALIPTESIKPLFDRLATCKLTESGLTKCDQDKKDLQIQLDAANVEAHQWKMAAKGGSRWHRFGKAAGVIGCAAGGGYLGSFAGKQAAAIGAGSGAGLCSFIF